MRNLFKTHLLLFSILFCGCSVTSLESPQNTVFERPQSHIGLVPEICGYLIFGSEDHNFYPNKKEVRQSEVGLGVKPRKLTADKLYELNGKYVCLRGEIYNRGCGVDFICTDSTHEFAIRVDEVLRD